MLEIIDAPAEPPQPATFGARRGRSPVAADPVACVETGRVFGHPREVVDWLAGKGLPATESSLRNALSLKVRYAGYNWRKINPSRGKPGPPKGAGGRPRKDAAPQLPTTICIPKVAVVDSLGRCYRDPEVAAQCLRDTGCPDATAERIVRAVADGVRVGDLYWDWRGRGWSYCHQEQVTGVKCAGCRERVAVVAGLSA